MELVALVIALAVLEHFFFGVLQAHRTRRLAAHGETA
jgi:hypothetical protein